MPVIVKLLMLAFLLYAAVTIISLRTQIADKQEELDSLSLRVQEYEEANAALQEEMQRGRLRGGHQRAGAQRAELCGAGGARVCRHVQPVKGKRITEAKKTYMDLAVGSIVEGKVTGITKFGAFVALPEESRAWCISRR